MSTLHKISVSLSDGQKRKLAKAYRDREEVSIKLAHKNLSGGDTLMVPENIVKRLAKSKSSGKGIQIKIARANIRKQTGSGILNSLFPVIRNFGPIVGKTMGLSALAGLASEGVGQLVRKITGGQIFQVPNKHLHRLAMMDNLLTRGQIRDLAKAYTDGSDMMFKVTNKQVGNGMGSILASIGIPLILDAFRGKGVGGSAPRIGKMSGGASPRIGAPPPYIGNWNTRGRGKKNNRI